MPVFLTCSTRSHGETARDPERSYQVPREPTGRERRPIRAPGRQRAASVDSIQAVA
jgi:hypothetical protein